MFPHTRKCFLILLFVVLKFDGNECWKSSRPSRPSSHPSPHRPFPTHSPTHRPFPTHAPTHRPFPTHAPTFRPFPTHAPTFRPFPTHAPTFKPFPTHAPTQRPFPTHSPTQRPFPTHAPTFRTTPSYRPFPTQSPTYRPFPTQSPTYRPFPTHSPTYRPFPTHSPTFRPSPTRAPTRYPTQPTRYPTQRYPIGPQQTYPGFGAGGTFNRPYQPSYPVRIPTVGGGSKVKIYNVHNYHSPGYFAPPSYPIYTYSHRDTGNSALGFYLGYNLGRITHPTYYHHHHSFYDGYSPVYDHYTVHHYYHNSAAVPKEQIVTSKKIIKCGDSSQICPPNTMALCTESGQIMCVVVAAQTVPCKDNPYLRCVQSTVPCENNDAPECKGVAKGETASIAIPCISNTTVQGNVTILNNTLISADRNKTAHSQNGVELTTLPTIETTLPIVQPTVPTSNPGTQYCVAVLAEPTRREPTEGELVFKEVTNVFDKFIASAFNMNNMQKT